MKKVITISWPPLAQNCLCRHYNLLVVLLLLLVVVVAAAFGSPTSSSSTNAVDQTKTTTNEEDDMPSGCELVADANRELTDETLGSLVKGFGQHIRKLMSDGMSKLLESVERGDDPDEVDSEKLALIKGARQTMEQEAEARIEMAGRKSQGESTQSSWRDLATSVRETFVSQVNNRLQMAGSHMRSQMSSMASMMPKLKGRLKALPAKLFKLMQWPSFLNYKIKFNKVYSSLREELYRQMIFLHTQTIVGLQNFRFLLGKSTHLLRATLFADQTDKEYHEAFHNELAESDHELAAQGKSLSSRARQMMEELARQQRNVFGQQVQVQVQSAKSRSHRPKAAGEHARVKRAISEVDEEDEEDEDYDDVRKGLRNKLDMGSSRGDDSGSSAGEQPNQDDEDEEEMYFDDLDELMEPVEEALNERGANFKPIDLRQSSCMIEPEDQYKCGACYAFVTAAVASYFNCMTSEKKEPVKYHARFISDCGLYLAPKYTRPTLRGCSGGRLTEAINFTRIAGARLWEDYTIRMWDKQIGPTQDLCALPRPRRLSQLKQVSVPFYHENDFITLRHDEIDLHLRTIGPVFVNLRCWKNFKHQGKFIYGDLEDDPKTRTIHSMLIVGHDRDQNGDYWILWNTHGVNWGDRGYAKIYDHSLEFFKFFYGGFMRSEEYQEYEVEHLDVEENNYYDDEETSGGAPVKLESWSDHEVRPQEAMDAAAAAAPAATVADDPMVID